MQYSVYVVHSVCFTRCMLYSVYAVLGVCWNSVHAVHGVCCTWCYLSIMAWRDEEVSFNFLFLGDGRVEDENERNEERWRKSF